MRDLSDGTVTLRPLAPSDAVDHLAGEDEELIRWLNGGRGTTESVAGYLDDVVRMWDADGPIFSFAVRHANTDVLMGTIDVQLDQPYTRPGVANLAFGLYPEWRGHGYASRAVMLAIEFMRRRAEIKEALIRAEPENHASSAVARRTGFVQAAPGTVPEDGHNWFTRSIAP